MKAVRVWGRNWEYGERLGSIVGEDEDIESMVKEVGV